MSFSSLLLHFGSPPPLFSNYFHSPHPLCAAISPHPPERLPAPAAVLTCQAMEDVIVLAPRRCWRRRRSCLIVVPSSHASSEEVPPGSCEDPEHLALLVEFIAKSNATQWFILKGPAPWQPRADASEPEALPPLVTPA